MRKLLAYVPCHACYWLGHAVSIPMERFDLGWLYPTYNRLMIASSDLSDWAGLGVWTECTHDEEAA